MARRKRRYSGSSSPSRGAPYSSALFNDRPPASSWRRYEARSSAWTPDYRHSALLGDVVERGMGRSPITAWTRMRPRVYASQGARKAPFHAKPVSFGQLLNRMWIRAPARVRFCVQRKERRSALFAFGVAGRRGSAPGKGGKYRRRVESSYTC